MQRGLEERIRKIAGDKSFKRRNENATWRGDAAVEIQDGGVNALFGLKAKVAIGDLNGDGYEDGAAGDAEKIGAIVHVNVVVDDASVDQFGESFQAFGRTLDAEVTIKGVQLVPACGHS